MKDKDKNSSTFCSLPFLNMATKTDGEIKLCCRSKPMGNINENTFEEIWNSENYKRIRRQLLNNERPKECKACWRLEDVGVTSLRQRMSKKRMDRFPDVLNNLSDDFSMPNMIRSLEMKMSNLCNLKCRMCHPLDSTQWADDWKHVHHLMKKYNDSIYDKVEKYDVMNKPFINGWEHNKEWWDIFEKFAPYLQDIEFAGGEPLIDPTHYKILDIMLPYADQTIIKYSTNLTKLQNVMELWDNFKQVDIFVSMDGVYDVFNYIRQLGDYNMITSNIDKIRDHPKIGIFRAAITFQMYNIMFLPEIFDTIVNECKIGLHSHRVSWPQFLDMRVMPEKIKTDIAKNLLSYYDSIDQKGWSDLDKRIAKVHIMDNHNYLISENMSYLLPEFVEFSDKLDKVQNVKLTWRDLMPELSEYVDGK